MFKKKDSTEHVDIQTTKLERIEKTVRVRQRFQDLQADLKKLTSQDKPLKFEK